MAAPPRGSTGHGCYFITASTFQKRNLLQSDRMKKLLIDVLFHYRQLEKYRLHEFVIMSDHFHLLLTPGVTLERSMQFIKGGFAFRAKRELGFPHEIWQSSYYDRRVRDSEEYLAFARYIEQNPVKKGLVQRPEQCWYRSAWPGLELDEAPQRLKRLEFVEA